MLAATMPIRRSALGLLLPAALFACASGPTSVSAPTVGDAPASTGASTATTATTATAASGAAGAAGSGSSSAPAADTPRADGLVITVLKPGSGPAAKSGETVHVHYVGTLTDGSKFDSSRARGTPFTFELGKGQVIKGWERGVVGMQVGEVRKLVIPPHLGYGERGHPPVIPAAATLVFEVELMGIE
jgi:FKBP-type peptidyl-prolyl cis-trans isomerase